ncbi:hypothetical protein BO70DRAFT_398011 [Aspergillus heteromorphus CBS 117.55]|uniref:Uncharacterized protein n=1 Tax=Aspergillus heteromorphus CBS 117.55 TaxID=1448321 RepID=A0A317VS19_9EURO|nr:uncharacterized protein BO70DRAFT_398011 [Aspergillus heteromorphus CBS 117.55]PWY77123.1 hypothetical protein BO70DRAFT_398011 [Aspergillus heteromorphus CBS 117.55]
MRYENWDVLVFPETSKVPLQEFKTQCFVTKDKESPYLHSPALLSPASCSVSHGNLGQLPVLTTFIPSMRLNTPFRVSVHSWEKPMPSRLMESLLQPEDALLFEIRIFIDGLCVSGSVFNQRSSWPNIIDLSSYVDKSGNQDSLRFPAFHQEILEQRHWDAGETYGRIRVVIAEGFSRPHRSPPFERVKEIVAFAFQHAPLQVLEYSNIAWPNASMWTREPRLFKYNSAGGPSEPKEAEDFHAHSPTRHDARRIIAPRSQISSQSGGSTWAYRNYQRPMPQYQAPSSESRWNTQEQCMPDPFIDPIVLDPTARHRGARPSWEDVPMPDYASSSGSSRAISSMTGISYEHSKNASIVTPMDEASYSQLIEALSPPKPLNCGTQAPTNTPSTAMPMGTKLSAAAEARSAPYTKNSSRASALKEISLPDSREISRTSTRSSAPSDTTADVTVANKINASPSPQVKSRKEGLCLENKGNESSVDSPIKENERAHQTPPRPVVRTSGNTETPTGSKPKPSTSSARGESSPISKGESVLFSPTQDLSAGHHVQQAEFDDFLDVRSQLVGSVLEVGDID